MSTEASRKRAVIRTFPPTANANYGGILQAWALAQVLGGLGLGVYVDDSRSTDRGRYTEFALRSFARVAGPLLPERALPATIAKRYISMRTNHLIFEFPRRNLELVRLYRSRRKIDPMVATSYDMFVVGSDQVWRTEYMDVESYLLDFLPPSYRGVRLAYAASFGTDTAEGFDEVRKARTAALAKRFNRISVREESGVAIAKDMWGVDAVRLPDPTLLLSPDRYRTLVGASAGQTEGIVSYVLDPDPSLPALAAEAAAALSDPVVDLQFRSPASIADYRANRDVYVKPSVERWLRAISEARLVVTDSFHGTVFAILFNRPFLVQPNRRRGSARFETLLSTFGLEDRIVRNDGKDLDRWLSPIDWGQVNSRIDDERERGINYLASSLAAGIFAEGK